AHDRARVGEWGELPLEQRPQVLVLVGQAELFAEMLWSLIDGEAGRARGDLEQDALRLAEVDRVEVVAIDHRRDLHPGLRHASLPGHVLLVAGMPGDVMDGSRAREPALARGVVGPVEVARLAVGPVLAVADLGEAERAGQQLAV